MEKLSPQADASYEAVAEFERLIAALVRLLSALSTIPTLKTARLGLSEWVALSAVQQAGDTSNKQLAAKLGVTRQRAHQLVAELAKAELIAVQVSPVDSRENVITLAPKGRKRLKAVNEELASLISILLGSRVKILPTMHRHATLLTKLMKPAKVLEAREAAGKIRRAEDELLAMAGRRGG